MQFEAFVKSILSCMPKRGVTQIMRQGNGFNQVFIKLQTAGN